jgi:antitoxin component YwqK of YwqJK toxin-antitoxin module
MLKVKEIIMILCGLATYSMATIQKCEQGVVFGNKHSYAGKNGTIHCNYYKNKNVKTKTINLKNGKLDGKVTTYAGFEKSNDTSNKVIAIEYYKNGKKVERKTFYASGKLKEASFTIKNKDEILKEYYKNGKQKKLQVTVNKIPKELREWYMNEKPKHIVYYKKNGKEAEVETYYDNGQLKEKYTYKPKGRFNSFSYADYGNTRGIGDSYTYFENGKLQEKIKRNNKNKIIKSTWYHETGVLKYETILEDTGATSIKVYNENGTLTENMTYYRKLRKSKKEL